MKECKKHEKAHCGSESEMYYKKGRTCRRTRKIFKVLNAEGSSHGGWRKEGSDSSYKKGAIYLQ